MGGHSWCIPVAVNVKDYFGLMAFMMETAWSVLKNLDKFFDLKFEYHSDKVSQISHCVDVLNKYHKMSTWISHRYDFTDNEIEEFQRDADAFYKKWIELNGREGMTNYIHIFGSGHASWYLKKYRNFYRYSNQSWEALIHRCKRIYFMKSQRGGHGGKEENRSHILPIMRAIQRYIMWTTGLGASFFEQRTWKGAGGAILSSIASAAALIPESADSDHETQCQRFDRARKEDEEARNQYSACELICGVGTESTT